MATLIAVIDATGRVIACGDASLVPPDGGRTIETDTNPFVAVPEGQEPYHDGKAFRFRPSQPTDDETERKDGAGLLAQIDQAIDGWATLTAVQKQNATLLVLKMIRLIARRVLR